MIKVLVISDAHIHDRADEIPKILDEIIRNNKPYDIAIYAGDFTDEDVYSWFKTLSSRTYAVQGNMDYLDLPEKLVINVKNLKIGLIHGHQVRPRGNLEQLSTIANKLGVKMLISGHTHSLLVMRYGNVLHVNPGSITGVWSGSGGSMRPSMIIMNINERTLELVCYELYRGKLEEKIYKFSRNEI